jgi:hypothetical protein
MEPQVVKYDHIRSMNEMPGAAAIKARMAVPDFFALLGDQVLDPVYWPAKKLARREFRC